MSLRSHLRKRVKHHQILDISILPQYNITSYLKGGVNNVTIQIQNPIFDELQEDIKKCPLSFKCKVYKYVNTGKFTFIVATFNFKDKRSVNKFVQYITKRSNVGTELIAQINTNPYIMRYFYSKMYDWSHRLEGDIIIMRHKSNILKK
jgi:hypothetical protein